LTLEIFECGQPCYRGGVFLGGGNISSGIRKAFKQAETEILAAKMRKA
jgi:hypothetical protein